MKIFLAILSTLFCVSAFGQNVLVKPFLSHGGADFQHIVWETDTNIESTVEWGLTEALGSTTSGTWFNSSLPAIMHNVELTGLSPATMYYYQVTTGSYTSGIQTFKTDPLNSAEASFNLVAMSDMQRSGSNPTKFSEIVNEGVLPVIQAEYGQNIADHVALVMIPGDLVVNGLDYDSWKEEFFNPAHALMKDVPTYPVAGNHEINSPYYFDYFILPENGTTGFEEHWYFKDYSNVRIIGLDSNSPYNGATQLLWLEDILAETCANDSIDFVFAQLHHPHKSELWLPGESGFATSVVERLEDFSTDCGKPSIHFFGHTHGYSRGQSKDHNHLMVNVATAGGAIDHWGEWPQTDYEEFTVSEAEYGFVVMEVEAGDDPQFILKRFSQGHEYNPKANELTDSILVKLNNIPPTQPVGLSPVDETVDPACVLLVGSNYDDPDNDTHMAAEWQLSLSTDFSNPEYSMMRTHENRYFFVDTQAGDVLIDEKVDNLAPNTTYFWRVRYRDLSLGWSPWSATLTFDTGDGNQSVNLIQNGGAENGNSNWIVVQGNLESLTAGECAGTSPYVGTYYFGVGGLCIDAAYGEAYQIVDVSAYQTEIDQGGQVAIYSAYMSDWSGADIPEIQIEFLDVSSAVIGSSDPIQGAQANWVLGEGIVPIPVGCTQIKYILRGYRNQGADNDSYMDEISLKIMGESDFCDDSLFDADQDGIIDSVDNCLDLANPEQGDFNDNGVGDVCEDSDEDGILDVDELLLFLTDPEQADSDFDGVNDYDEVFVEGTNPLLQDTDGDGLTDLLELETSGTDPLNPDTDMDGCNDALYFGMMCAGQGDNCEVDTNGDGIINVLDLVNISSFFGLICPF